VAHPANLTDFSHFGGNLRLFRLARRLTQQQLAQRAGEGFSQTYVCRLERGLRPSEEQHVSALAGALSVSTQALLRRPRRIGISAIGNPIGVGGDTNGD
jgi:transcriptional regulator with XRE-family HTH domain